MSRLLSTVQSFREPTPAETVTTLGEPAEEEESTSPLLIALGVAAAAAGGFLVYKYATSSGGSKGGEPPPDIVLENGTAATAFSDCWSQKLVSAYKRTVGDVPREKHDFRSSKWLPIDEWTELMEEVCPTYNFFEAKAVGERLKDLGITEVQVAREGSPAAYVRGPKQAMSALLKPSEDGGVLATQRPANGGLDADRAVRSGKVVHLWWD